MPAPPAVHSFSALEFPTAAHLDSYAAGITYLNGGASGQAPSFGMSRATAQAVPANTDTPVVFTSVDEDTDGGCSGGIYTVASEGLWLLTAGLAFASSTSGSRQIILATTGSNVTEAADAPDLAADSIGRCSASMLVRLAAADTVTLFADSTVATTTYPSAARVWLTGRWMGL